MFWGVMAIIWVWDAITGYTTFERTHKYDVLSYVLLAMPFIYPMVSLARGLSFPGNDFSGDALFRSCIYDWFIIALCLQSKYVPGTFPLSLVIDRVVQNLFLPDSEDFLLASATIPGLYLFFREYFLNNLHADTKPKAKYINWLLITVCVGLAVLLTTTMFLELVPKN